MKKSLLCNDIILYYESYCTCAYTSITEYFHNLQLCSLIFGWHSLVVAYKCNNMHAFEYLDLWNRSGSRQNNNILFILNKYRRSSKKKKNLKSLYIFRYYFVQRFEFLLFSQVFSSVGITTMVTFFSSI